MYDLLIQGSNDLVPRNVSINMDFIVLISSELEKEANLKVK